MLMNKNRLIANKNLSGERAEYFSNDVSYVSCVFSDGESPLKHANNVEVLDSRFEYKYPLWNSQNVFVKNCEFAPLGKSGLWNTNGITMEDTVVDAPKEFRRSVNTVLRNVKFTDAAETFWNCDGVRLENVQAKGDYFALNTQNFYADNLNLDGNYFLDGGKNIEIHNSRIVSKDAFWNSENVTVYDSYILGEYLGWHSKNLKFVNCTIESDQGLCYVDGLVLENCTLNNTVLAFEYSTGINASISGKIESVKNPCGGKITADEIGTLILNPKRCNPNDTEIICGKIENTFHKDPNQNENEY